MAVTTKQVGKQSPHADGSECLQIPLSLMEKLLQVPLSLMEKQNVEGFESKLRCLETEMF